MVYREGVDIFYSDPKKPEVLTLQCLACGEPLRGRKETGPHSFTAAMAGTKTTLWVYMCPHNEKHGHDDLVKLQAELVKFASERLRKIVAEELLEKRMVWRHKILGKP